MTSALAPISRKTALPSGTCSSDQGKPDDRRKQQRAHQRGALFRDVARAKRLRGERDRAMRRNTNSQNRQSNTTDDIATAPRRCACPSLPMTAVATTPSSGVVAFGSVIGTAIASTRRWVTVMLGGGLEGVHAAPLSS